MSDPLNNDDSLERLFQKKTGDYHIPFKEEDWMEMERLLDARSVQIGYRRKLRMMAAASLLIFTSLGYFIYENSSRINQLTRQLQEESVMGRTPQPVPDLATPRPDEEMENTVIREGGTGTEVTNIPAGQEREGELSLPDVWIAGIGKKSIWDVPGGSSFMKVRALPPEDRMSPFEARDSMFSQQEVPRPENVLHRSEKSGKGPVLAVHYKKTSSFSLGFVISPDLSTVGSFSNFHEPGYKIGVVLGYQLNRHISVTAGAIQSEVRYLAPAASYNPPTNWNYGVTPDETFAVCLLIDIPVTVKFNFLELDRSGFYATAGLSSYIMLNEDYRFTYGNSAAGMEESWSGKTGTRHWFSNAGFSLGYEMELNPNWSLRAEPFIRVPLKEVGWGNVKLYSVGSYVSVHYNF